MNSNNNNKKEIEEKIEKLFLKIFKNVILRNQLLSQIKENNFKISHDYNSTISLKEMFKHKKYEIILDKLKSNHLIDFNSQSIGGLDGYNNYFQSIKPYHIPMIEEIYKQLSIKYNYIFKSINILENSIINKYSFIFKNYINSLFYSFKIINKNQNNNNNRINPFYRLYSLMDLSIQHCNFNSKDGNIEIPLLLIDTLKEYFNNEKNEIQDQIIEGKNKKRNKIEKEFLLQSISNIDNEQQIIELIYNDRLEEIPIYSNNILVNLISKTLVKKDIVKFVENHLNIDIGSIIFKYKNDSCHQISIGNILNKRIIDQYISILLNDYEKTINLYQFGIHYYINNIDHAKLYLLEKINYLQNRNFKKQQQFQNQDYQDYQVEDDTITLNNNIKYTNLKNYLIKNNDKILKIENLIEIVENQLINNNNNSLKKEEFRNDYFNIKKIENLFNYLGEFYLYYLLKENQFKIIQENINYYFNLDLVFSYSIYKFSIEYLKICIGYNGFKNFNGFTGKSNFYTDDLEKDKSIALNFFNYLSNNLNSSESISILNQSHWFRILKIIIIKHDSNIMKFLIEENSFFKFQYQSFLVNEFKELLKFHLTEDSIKKEINLIKFQIFLNHLIGNSIKIIYYKLIEDSIHINIKSIKEKEYSRLLKFLLNFNQNQQIKNENSIFLELLINELYYNSQFLNLNYTLEVYQIINQQYLEEFYKNNFYSFFKNKSNILIDHLILLIINKNINSIIKIIKIMKKEIDNQEIQETEIYDNITYNLDSISDSYNNDSFFKILNNLNLNNYLKYFNIECLIEKILEKIEIKNYNYQLILNLIPNQQDSINIKENFQNYFNQLFNNGGTIEEGKEKELENKKCEVLTFYTKEIDLSLSLRKGYYPAALEFIEKASRIKDYSKMTCNLNTLNSPSESLIFSLIENNISIIWFTKLYNPLIKTFLNGAYDNNYKYIKDLSINRFDIFEFLWSNHLLSSTEKERVIYDLFESMATHQLLIEYVLKEKRDFIINEMKLKKISIFKLHKGSLVYGNPKINQLVREMFVTLENPLKIDFNILKDLIIVKDYFNMCRYDVIEYLYENNLIPNLKEILGNNLDKLIIKELKNDEKIYTNCNCHYKKYHIDSIVITKSMFILLHLIIKKQQ